MRDFFKKLLINAFVSSLLFIFVARVSAISKCHRCCIYRSTWTFKGLPSYVNIHSIRPMKATPYVVPTMLYSEPHSYTNKIHGFDHLSSCKASNVDKLHTSYLSFKSSMRLNAVSERTKRYFESVDSESTTGQAGGAGGSSKIETLISIDKQWEVLKNGGWKNPPRKIVYDDKKELEFTKQIDATTMKRYDIVICGGTLGIFYAIVCQLTGWSTCVIERSKVLGREQVIT